MEVFLKNGIKCTNCGFIYFHNMASAVGGIIETADGILLAQRAHEPRRGFYDLPGGFVDYGESLETAMKREINEETGINITEMSYLGSFPNTYIYEDVTYFTSDAFFVCRIPEGEKPEPSEEICSFLICKPGEIPFEKIAFDSAKAALRYYASTTRFSTA